MNSGRPATGAATAARAAGSRWAWVAAAGVLLVFAAQIWAYFGQAYYAGVDEATYFLTAKSLAVRHTPVVYSPDPLVFVPGNMNEIRPGVFIQKYPIGFPLLVAAGYALGGQTGAFLVNPVFGCLALIAAMALTAELAGAWPGVVLGLVLALHPLMVCYSTGALSHISDLACVVGGLWLLWRWGERGGWGWAAGAGALLGYAVSIRYTEAILGLVVLWIVWHRLRAFPWRRRVGMELAAMALGALAALTPLLIFQWKYYGAPWRTGYGLTGESTAFSWASFRAHAGLVLSSMNAPGFGLPGLFPVAMVGLIVWLAMVIWRRRRARGAVENGTEMVPTYDGTPGGRHAMNGKKVSNRRWAATFGRQEHAPTDGRLVGFLLLWIVPTLLLYTAYYWSAPEPTLYMRLFLTAYAGIAVAAIVTLDRVSRNRTWLRAALAVAVVAVALLGRTRSASENLLLNNASLIWVEQRGADLARSTVPPDAVLIGDDWTAFDLVFATNCRVLFPKYFDADWVAQRVAVARRGGPLEFNPLRAREFFPLVAGRNQAQLDELFRDEIRKKLDQGKTVALLTTDLTSHGQVDRRQEWAQRLGNTFQLELLKRTELTWAVYRIRRR